MKNNLFIFLLVFVVGISGCVSQSETVTVNDLLDYPSKYNNKNIIVEGFYFHSQESNPVPRTTVLPEINVLAVKIRREEGLLAPADGLIWLEKDEKGTFNDYNKLYIQDQPPGYNWLGLYGKVRVTGHF